MGSRTPRERPARRSRAAAIAALLLGVLCAEVLSGCVVIETAPLVRKAEAPKPHPRSSAPTRSAESTAPALIGSRLVAGRLAVVASSHRERKAFGVQTARASREYLFVEVDFANGGWETYEITPGDFAMKDPAGKVVTPVPTSVPAYNARSMRPLAPGYGTSTAFVYDIARRSGGYVFSYRPKGGKKTLRWVVP